ncbi:MAG TPA: 23S rRNA (uracil(1939)-C(5))-methyltransferase RlmD [Candidatus Binatia bacterium]|jgi:23S rRNA (uracil1939-C5)-methyltransferase
MNDAIEKLRLKIDALAYGPYGIGRHNGRVVMVPLTVPGDEVEATIVEDKGNYAVGALAELVVPSPARQEPPCTYVGDCGGCPWQMVEYEAQLEAKQKSVADALRRIGKLENYELLPIIPSPEQYRYRRRIRLHVAPGPRLGYHRLFSHQLIEIASCLIASEGADRRLGAARAWIERLVSHIVELEIVESDEHERVVFAGKVDGAIVNDDDAAAKAFLGEHRDVAGLVLFGKNSRRSWGNDKIVVAPEDGLAMEVDAEVFTQVNRDGNRLLVRELIDWGALSASDRVLELYSGAGNFTLPIAGRAGDVVAVEADARAVVNGKKNADKHNLKNVRWVQAHAPQAARRLREAGERFTKIVLDPPRSGAKGLEDDLARLGAATILYVSCNPATLARDLAALAKKGYVLKRVRPFDLFPHTFHVEALAELALE